MTPSSRRSLRRTAATTLILLALLAAGCRHHRRSTSAPNTADYADNIKAVLAKPQLALLRWPNYSDYQPAVATFYDDRNYELAWLRDLRPTPEATAFIAAFQDAGAKGLNPEDYDASLWPARVAGIAKLAAARDDSDAAADTIAQFDAAMTVCVMRYISDLRIGRVNPQHFNFDINVADKKYNLAEFLSDNAVDATDVPALIRKVEPDSDQYRATEAALARYLALARLQAAAAAPPLPQVEKSGVGVTGEYSATGPLLARLQLEGDAPGDYPYHPAGAQAAPRRPRLNRSRPQRRHASTRRSSSAPRSAQRRSWARAPSPARST